MANVRRPPTIELLSTADNIGGMERVICGLAREFTARGCTVRTVFPDTPKRAALLNWCAEQGVTAETSPALLDAAAPHTWNSVKRLAQFLRERSPDIVSLHYGDNFISLKDLLAVRLSGRRRCVVTVYHPTSWKEAGSKKRLLTRAAAMFADEITTISDATYDILREAGIPKRKLHNIPCGLRLPQQLLDRGEARARLGLPADATIIGSLARLVPHKGIDELIKATARLAGSRNKLFLAIAGDGPERPALQQLSASLLGDKARLLGRVPDVDEFFAACDFFVLPSHLEGFGLVYAEAAFHGVPSIGTNVGGVPDAVVHDRTGLLVPVNDLDALTNGVQRLFDDTGLRQRLGIAARARAHAEFTEHVMADRFEPVFGLSHLEGGRRLGAGRPAA